MPPEIGKALDLIQQFGPALAGLVFVTFVLLKLFAKYEASWIARLADAEQRIEYTEKLRVEERTGRLDVEGRLASNSETLREATNVFAASQQFQQQLVEKLVERDAGSRGRRT